MRKNVQLVTQIITAGDMSQATITSTVIDTRWMDNVGLQIEWTSADAVGTIEVQASVNGTTYHAITFSPALTQPASNNGGYLVNLNQLPYEYFKVVYTRTSGTGVLNVWSCTKEI